MKISELKNIIRQTIKQTLVEKAKNPEKIFRCCGNGFCDTGCKGKPCEKGQKYCPKRDYPTKSR